MRVILQRVDFASVSVAKKVKSQINYGLLIFLGIEKGDSHEDVSWLTNKILSLRIFSNDKDHMDRSILDVSGEIMVISQFTLHAKTKKGNRPSYIRAANAEIAKEFYEFFIQNLKSSNLNIQSGVFGADMKIELINNGPVTIFIDSKKRE